MASVPNISGQWIAIPGRITPDQKLRVSVVATMTVESDVDCARIAQLDRQIPGLLDLITKWPTIVRALKQWTVDALPCKPTAAAAPAIGTAPMARWDAVEWQHKWFRCEKPSKRALDSLIVPSATAAAGQALKAVHRDVRQAVLTKGATLHAAPPNVHGAFSTLIEAPATLGSFDLKTLAITQSRYRPEEDAPKAFDGLRDRLKQAKWRALDPDGNGKHLTPAARAYLWENRTTDLERLKGHAGLVPMIDYFTARALPCPTAKHELLDDFQEWWNGFLAYPTLARLFGIIVEVDVDCALAEGEFSLQVKPDVPDVPEIPPACRTLLRTNFKALWTSCTALAIPPEGPLVVVVTPADHGTFPGLANLTDCGLESTNADDAISKMRAAAEAERTKVDSGTLEVDEDSNLPSGSTWGLALQNAKHAVSLAASRKQAPTGTQENPLRAPQLRAGFRYDIMVWNPAEVRTPWRSLCRRRVTYDKDGPNAIDCEGSDSLRRLEEGIVRTAGRMFAGDRAEGHVVDDELFVWTDWPLCVPPDDDPLPPSSVEIPIGQHVALANDHDVALRFGYEYAVAGRDAYLDGGGLSTEEAAALRQTIIAAGSSKAATYECTGVFERVEPLRPPEIHLTDPIDPAEHPGDQIDHIVVRSGPDVNSKDRHNRRYVLAPRVSTDFAGVHPNAFDALGHDIEQPAGAFPAVALTCLGDIPTVQWVHEKLGPDHLPATIDDTRRHDTIVVFDRRFADEVVHEYYPDPEVKYIRGGIVEHRASCWGDEIPPFEVYRRRDWPDARLLRIDVEAAEKRPAGSCSASWEREGADVLEIELAPAADLVLKLWSGPVEEARHRMQAYRDTVRIAREHELAPSFTEGVMRDLSVPFANPTRELRLIHAVQKPLSIPRFGPDANVGRRRLHDLAALFEGYATIDRASTVQLDVFATTRVFVDDVGKYPQGPQWEEVPSATPVVKIENIGRDAAYPDRVALDVDDDGVKRARTHEISSSKRHAVTYWLEAVSRYASYFPALMLGKGLCRTTKADAERGQATWTVDILSSSAPQPPDVRTITPLFRETETHGRQGDAVSRRCVGFRVRLGRPFFTTGDGQRLAVVCWPPGTFGPGQSFPVRRASVGSQSLPADKIPPDLEPFVSRIAEDPVWPGSAPFEVLPPDFFAGGAVGTEMIDFPGAVEQRVDDVSDASQRPGGSPPKAPALRTTESPVSIVSYPVDVDSLDLAAQEFSCDIGISPAALARRPDDQPYFPFLRLALACHQPASVPGGTLSPIVVADLVQVHPDRSAQVIYQRASGRARLIVRGFGQPEFVASSRMCELLEHDNVAFQLRAQLLRRGPHDSVEVPTGPPVVLAIDRDRDGYYAAWDLPIHSLASRVDRLVLFVEEVWLVPTDPRADPAMVVETPRYAYHEHPRVLLRLPLLAWSGRCTSSRPDQFD